MLAIDGNRYYVYILSSPSGTLYIGVTNDIKRRVAEHKSGINEVSQNYMAANTLYNVESFYDINSDCP